MHSCTLNRSQNTTLISTVSTFRCYCLSVTTPSRLLLRLHPQMQQHCMVLTPETAHMSYGQRHYPINRRLSDLPLKLHQLLYICNQQPASVTVRFNVFYHQNGSRTLRTLHTPDLLQRNMKCKNYT